ncbi:MAG TPA: hypothetical protein PLF11_00140 [Bacillota bacterium]|mgnify:CR=1 FL=1|nr:hypothetical protein [Dermatophilaceae bacterium]HOI35767.1 hypothetical protein [Bacillota bacterium]
MSELNPQVQVAQIGSVDPTGSPVYNIGKIPTACKGTAHKFYMVNGTAHAAHATNTNTVSIYRVRAGTSTKIAEQTNDEDVTGHAAIEADKPWAIPLLSNALGELAADDCLQAVFTEGAAAQDLTEVAIYTEWSPGTGLGHTG